MSTDEDYASFLDKANQGTDVKTSSKSGFAQTKSVDTDIPVSLKSLDAFYTSDTDEPFEPVALQYSQSKKLDEDSFSTLIGHSGQVESLDLTSWNAKDQYSSVVEAVKKSASDKSEIKVFRVSHGTTRCEYYVVALSPDDRLVGVKARAVES